MANGRRDNQTYLFDPIGRFVTYLKPNGACIDWTARKDKEGYGTIVVFGKQMRATHFCLRYLKQEPRPSEQHQAAHSCDRPSCVNPRHLRWATGSENLREAVAKGRKRGGGGRLPGEANHFAVLTEADVREIRALHGLKKRQEVADRFGVTLSAVKHIWMRHTWRHVA